jgi:hypothetical protein
LRENHILREHIEGDILREHSGNILEHNTYSGNIQGTYREHSGNIQGTFREHPRTQYIFREHSGNIQGTS